MQGKVTAGVSTLSLGGVSVLAYVAAVVAFFSGTRDEVTVGTAVIGTVSLLGMAAGRFWQAVEKIRTPTPPTMLQPAQTWGGSGTGAIYKGLTTTTPRPTASIDWAGVKDATMARDLGEDAPDPDPPTGPDKSIANPLLDDPAAIPTAALHSHLKG